MKRPRALGGNPNDRQKRLLGIADTPKVLSFRAQFNIYRELAGYLITPVNTFTAFRPALMLAPRLVWFSKDPFRCMHGIMRSSRINSGRTPPIHHDIFGVRHAFCAASMA